MSDQPTADEWTAEYLHSIGISVGKFTADAICYAHNAALADQKRDLWEKISLSRMEADNWKGLYEKNQQQLAAEREEQGRIRMNLADAVEALREISNLERIDDNAFPAQKIADAALAKIGGKP